MAAKTNKTRVTLPGSLADLVRDLQDGGAQGVRNAQDAAKAGLDETKVEEQVVDNQPKTTADRVEDEPAEYVSADDKKPSDEAREGENVSESTPDTRVNRIIGGERQRQEGDDEGQRRGRPQKENTMKTYQIQKDDSADSWDLFLDLAKQYKTGGGRPATIYIDPALKNILDRLKYPLSLTTSSILSSIVARFIYDHEEDVRKAIFSQNIF